MATDPVDSVTVHRPLPGVELWAWRVAGGRSEMSLITHGYMFGGPDRHCWDTLRTRLRVRGTDRTLSGSEGRSCFEPGELARNNLESEGPSSSHVLVIDPGAIARYVSPDAPGARLRLRDPFSFGSSTIAAFERAQIAIESPLDLVTLEHHLRAFLDFIFARGDDEPPPAPPRTCVARVRRARELVESRYAEGLTLDEIAKEVGMSVYHLERSFAQSLGVPLHRYLQLVRIRHALTLIRSGTQAVDAATACGFADQAHMTRTFRRRLRFTPGQYRPGREPVPP